MKTEVLLFIGYLLIVFIGCIWWMKKYLWPRVQPTTKTSDIDKMIYCIEQAAICSKDTPDTRWLIDILLKNANEIKNKS